MSTPVRPQSFIINPNLPFIPLPTEHLNSKETAFFPTNLWEIDQLQEINGVSIEEIEKRARPLSFSACGFLGENESFKDVLKNDWQMLHENKITYEELGRHLRKIITIGERARNEHKIPDFFSVLIDYRTKDLEGNTLFSEKSQPITVLCVETKGEPQYDIFRPHDLYKKTLDTLDIWADEIILQNRNLNITLRLTSGSLAYIEHMGFFEGGGDSNPYRNDPAKILAVLTGRTI